MSTAEDQYYELKKKYPDCILLFRMGDFYEVFDNDAKTLAKEIGLTLTSRDRGEVKRPMAGIPYHALPQYLGKIVKLGFKVALAEQLEKAGVTKGVIKRDVVKVITNANLIDDKNLTQEENSFILSIYLDNENQIYFSYVDISTGQFLYSYYKINKDNLTNSITSLIKKINPKELIIPAKLKTQFEELKLQFPVIAIDNYEFDPKRNIEITQKYYKVSNTKGFGLEGIYSIVTIGVLINYLQKLELKEFTHLHIPQFINLTRFMHLDGSTIRNLELIESNNNNLDTSLYKILNSCVTPMGKRFLKFCILNPLIDKVEIQNRYDTISILISLIDNINLDNIYDIERIAARIGLRTISPKDFIILKNSLVEITNLISIPQLSKISQIATLSEISEINDLIKLINDIVIDNPSFDIKDGGVVKSEFNPELNDLRAIKDNSKKILLQLQQKEIEKTGITNLKIKFTNVFGYFIEISKSNINKVPEYFIRRQTLANAERYVTNELKEIEDKILSADEKILAIELKIYTELIETCQKYITNIQKISQLIAEFDLLCGFANNAIKYNYTKPTISESANVFKLSKGRHPIVEYYNNFNFTPNALSFDEVDIIKIITGPNMSGKSTFIRMIAVISLMAQIGSFVPAESLEFSLFDKIFTRIGASDSLSTGESTFMVEMNETANILNNATSKSLIILDEVGRGTSTYDGLSIATSVIIDINDRIKARTLFATHYHELTKLEGNYKKIQNLCVEVIEKNNQIIFSHRIISGKSSKSFGLHVAMLAGIPQHVISNAEIILKKLESNSDRKRIEKENKDQEKLF